MGWRRAGRIGYSGSGRSAPVAAAPSRRHAAPARSRPRSSSADSVSKSCAPRTRRSRKSSWPSQRAKRRRWLLERRRTDRAPRVAAARGATVRMGGRRDRRRADGLAVPARARNVPAARAEARWAQGCAGRDRSRRDPAAAQLLESADADRSADHDALDRGRAAHAVALAAARRRRRRHAHRARQVLRRARLRHRADRAHRGDAARARVRHVARLRTDRRRRSSVSCCSPAR